MRNIKFIIISSIIIIFFALFGLDLGNEPATIASPEKGKLDLEGWEANNILEVNGEWEYYQNKLFEDIRNTNSVKSGFVHVPHLWEMDPANKGNPYGYATYRVTLSSLQPGKNYALYVNDESLAYRVIVNGEDVIVNGIVGKSKDTYRPIMKTQWGVFRSDENGRAEMVMEIANFDYHRGGFWLGPKIGSFSAISKVLTQHRIVTIFLFSSIISMGLFFLALFSMARDEKPALYFAIFCILTALKILFTDHRLIAHAIPSITWSVENRLEYMLSYFLLPSFGYFIHSLNYVKKHKYILYLYSFMFVTSILLTSFFPSEIYAHAVQTYRQLVLFCSIYFLYVLIKGIQQRQQGVEYIVLGTITIVSASLSELFFIKRALLMPIATFALIAFFSLTIISKLMSIKRTKESLESEIILDPLTGLYNRFYLSKIIDLGAFQVQKNHKAFVMFLDLDNLKEMNDTYGHKIGDDILRTTGIRLKKIFRESDKIFRYGGDEFVILTEIDENKDIYEIVERAKNSFMEPIMLNDLSLIISASIGVASYNPLLDNLETVIRRSDDAMYIDKKTKKPDQWNWLENQRL